MTDLVASEIRRVHRKLARHDRRLALVDLTGKVKPGSQDMEKRTVRLVLGKSAEGREILGPPARWDTGGAGRLKTHQAPADNEQMSLHSPSGLVGVTSLTRYATYDRDNAPPSKSKDEAVLEFDGLGKITFGKESIKLTVGDKSGFEVTKDELKMLGRFRAKGGEYPAHYKGGKDDDGDTAVDGNENMLV